MITRQTGASHRRQMVVQRSSSRCSGSGPPIGIRAMPCPSHENVWDSLLSLTLGPGQTPPCPKLALIHQYTITLPTVLCHAFEHHQVRPSSFISLNVACDWWSCQSSVERNPDDCLFYAKQRGQEKRVECLGLAVSHSSSSGGQAPDPRDHT